MPLEVAEGLNEYFSNIGAKLAENVSPSTTHYSDYLPEPTIFSFWLCPVTQLEIKQIINELKLSS